MSQDLSDLVVATAIHLQKAGDRIYDCFVESRQYNTEYGECKLRCIAADEAVDVIGTVHYNEGYPTGAYSIRRVTLTGTELVAHLEMPLNVIAVANSDFGLVATVIAVQGVMSYTTWEPEDDHIEFCTELLIQMCAAQCFERELPEVRLVTDFQHDGDDVQYTGAALLWYEDGDSDRIEVQVASQTDATAVSVFSLSLTDGDNHASSFMELSLGDATYDVKGCRSVAAARLAREIARHTEVIE